VILTDSDPAVDSAVRQVFPESYPIHCAYHITQNLHKNLRKILGDSYKQFLANFYTCRNTLTQSTFEKRFEALLEEYPAAKSYLDVLYKSKHFWAHCFTNFKFTGGMIATSRVEAMNACLKRLLYNSDVSLCELVFQIQQLLDGQDKQQEYDFWRLAIPSIKHQVKANFLFTKVDSCIEQFLTPKMLKMQRDEINQSVYYAAKCDTLDSNKDEDEDKEEKNDEGEKEKGKEKEKDDDNENKVNE